MWHTFEAGGRTLSYLRRGSGRLLVCVPGGPGMDPESYYSTFEVPGHEQLIFAPRGTGRSTAPRELSGYRIAGYVEDLESLREHLGLQRLTLYGNSHGGMSTLAYVCAHPDRVERFVVTNPPPRIDDAYEQAAAEAERRFAREAPEGAERLAAAQAADAALEHELDPAERVRQYRALLSRYVAVEGEQEREFLDRVARSPTNWEAVPVMWEEMVGGLDLLAGAERVLAPALVIAGELDNVVPAAATRSIAQALPHASYLEIPGVCHFPEVEARTQLARAVALFLEQ